MYSNHRMVEGPPLQYYNNYNQFQYFHTFDPYYSDYIRQRTISGDDIMPASPNSTQSDSDNSISSVEVSPQQIRLKKSDDKSEVKCCWRSCGIIFQSLDQLANHVSKVHAACGPGGLFYCGWEGCSRNNKGFNARYKMLVHVRTHTNEKPHQCFQCDKSFSRAENLKIHSRSHSGEKPYVCSVPGCNKAYSNSSDRFKHTRTHQVEKPYQCKVPGCSKRYTDPSSLRKHVKTYKHFVDNENQPNNDYQKLSLVPPVVPEAQPKTRLPPYYNVDVINNLADSKNVCGASNCVTFSNSADILYISSWKRFLDRSIDDFNDKIGGPTESMIDVDMPLDLSVSRKTV